MRIIVEDRGMHCSNCYYLTVAVYCARCREFIHLVDGDDPVIELFQRHECAE